jgi:protein-tyrosine phosphatase
MKILMVCLGNICRSPIAEGILRKKAEERNINIVVDSAGTSDWHEGEHPDPRAVRTAKKFGVDISKLRARPFIIKDFSEFHRIYVMDRANHSDVMRLARNRGDTEKVKLLLEALFPGSSEQVPDPYYGDEKDFETVFNMMDRACGEIIKELEDILR